MFGLLVRYEQVPGRDILVAEFVRKEPQVAHGRQCASVQKKKKKSSPYIRAFDECIPYMVAVTVLFNVSSGSWKRSQFWGVLALVPTSNQNA